MNCIRESRQQTPQPPVAALVWAALAAAGLTACQTTAPPDSNDAGRPFPFAAWLAAEQRLLDSPTPYHIQTAPEPVTIRGRDPRKFAVSEEEARLAGRTYVPTRPDGPRRIIVDLAQQKAWVLRGDWVEAVTRVSTGRRSFPTPPGPYVVTQKKADHRSNLYGNYVDAAGNVVQSDVDVRTDPVPEGAVFVGSPMPFFQRLRDPANKIHGVGFHAGTLPGYPASHGCIRLPYAMAQWLFEVTKPGTQVRIIPAYPMPAPGEARKRPAKKEREVKRKPSPRPSAPRRGETLYF